VLVTPNFLIPSIDGRNNDYYVVEFVARQINDDIDEINRKINREISILSS
jgi:hypothetical protein